MSDFTYRQGNYVCTATVLEFPNGFAVDWWVSFLTDDRMLRVVGHVSLPVTAETYRTAVAAMKNITDSVVSFVVDTWSGESTPFPGEVSSDEIVDHMAEHYDALATLGCSDFEITAALYALLSDFRVQNPAVALADFLNVSSVRTIHDRIARARRENMLPSPGQGRVG